MMKNMATTVLITIILLVTTVFGLIGWDIYVALNDTDGDTISRVLQYWAYKAPATALFYGMVGGHIYCNWGGLMSKQDGLAFLLWLLWVSVVINPYLVALPIVIFPIVGFILGGLFWPLSTINI